MKLNEKEKQALIKSLKDDYNRNVEMLDSDWAYWLKDENERQKLVEHNAKIKELYEYYENVDGEVEVEFDFDKFKENNNWIWLLILVALFSGWGGNNSNE